MVMGDPTPGGSQHDDIASTQENVTQDAHRSVPDNDHLALSFLIEYLDADPLPAFIVHLAGDLPDARRAVLHHTNPTLSVQTPLQTQIADCLSIVSSNHGNDTQCSELHEWLSNILTKDSRSTTDARSSLKFCGFRWTAQLMRGQWAVVVAAERIEIDNSTDDVVDRTETGDGRTSNAEDNVPDLYPLGRLRSGGQLGNSEHLGWIQHFDWASTSLGPIHTWSSQLRQSCEMMLAAPEPVAVVWGQDLTIIFNEAYVPIYGENYRKIMGRTLQENWPPATFDVLFRQIQEIWVTGKASQQCGLKRYFPHEGQLMESYFSMTMMPVLACNASVAGLYCYTTDTTKQTIFERRTRTLIDINDSLASSRSMHDVWQSVVSVLSNCKDDIHFVAVYARSDVPVHQSMAPQVTLEAAVGVHDDQLRLVFDSATTAKTDLGVAVDTAFDAGLVGVLSLKDATLSTEQLARFTECGVEQPTRSVVVHPLMPEGDESVEAVMVIGTSPVSPFDDDYRIFLRLLRKQLESAITVVKLIEQERALLQERATVQSEKKFMLFAEKAPVGIYMFDYHGSLRFCNEAFEKISDASQADLVDPMAWTTVVHPESMDECQAYWNRLTNGEGPLIFEMQFKKPWKPTNDTPESLDRTWGLISSYPDVSENGELRGVFGCVVDISYVKWTEKIQSERLSEALELKRQQENFLDMTSHEIRNPLNAMSHCASELAEQLNREISIDHQSDSRMAALVDSLDMVNTISYCAKHQKRIIDDVLTLSKLDSRLLQIYPMRTNPTELVAEVLRLFNSEFRAYDIETATDVLEGYRKLGIEEVMADPLRVSQIIINLLSNAIKFVRSEKHRHLRLSIDASDTQPVDDNRQDLRYVPSGTHRQDPTETDGWGDGQVLFLSFSIQDTGPGMNAEQEHLLFNRFSQASPRTHAHYGGSGLGLFISRELTEMHGGRIGLSSQSEQGSTFSFYVKCRLVHQDIDGVAKKLSETLLSHHLPTPVEDGPATSKVDSRSFRSQTPKVDSSWDRKRRVLIVEDNLINQRLLKRLILKNGYDASVANHGEEALAIIHTSAWCVGTEHPRLDIVLCDIEMPIMDGKTCVRRIRQLQHEGILHPSIPVVAVTGNARAEQIQSARESGFDDVVCKPYEAQELLAVINEILGTTEDNG